MADVTPLFKTADSLLDDFKGALDHVIVIGVTSGGEMLLDSTFDDPRLQYFYIAQGLAIALDECE